MVALDKQTKPRQWQEGEYTVTRSTAWSGPGCHNGCGVLLYTKDGVLKKVEGDPEDSFNMGRLCPRCLALPEVVNHPDRLKYPLKRVGERGEGKWERISWEEAYDTIEKRFKQISEKYGPESIVAFRGTGRDAMWQIGRLMYAIGSPNESGCLSGTACYLPRVAAMVMTTGAFPVADCSQYFADRYNHPDWKVPECIVLWGNNPVVSNPDYFYGYWIVDCMKRGSKLITIDPRLTWLASRSELWLPIRPGTDGALALGMLNIIIQEKLYDKEFVDKWTYGFDKLAERAAQYPVDKVSKITWIPEEKIIAAARMYATSKPAAIQWGLAVDMQKNGVGTANAIASLWAITGNLDVPGGNIFTVPPFGVYQPAFGGWGYQELLTSEQWQKKLGWEKYPMTRYGLALAQPDDTLDAMETDRPYPIKGAWIQTTNPMAAMATDPKRWYAAFKKMDFVAAVDLFMTPTIMAFADIVLPAATYPEKDSIRAVYYYISPIVKAVQPVEEAKSDLEINIEIGKRFNPDAWPGNNVEKVLDEILKPAGMTFKQLKEKGPTYPPYEYRKYEKGLLREDGEPGFPTPTGRIELYSTLFENFGLDPLPSYEEPSLSPVSTPELYEKYPLILITGVRSPVFFHAEHRQIPVLREIQPEPVVEIHPDTATQYGIKDGDWIWIENQKDRIRQKAKITPIIHPKMVLAQHAWWFPEKPGPEPSLFGVWDVNVNRLLEMKPGKTGFGADIKCCLCKIYKVKEGEV